MIVLDWTLSHEIPGWAEGLGITLTEIEAPTGEMENVKGSVDKPTAEEED
jgi:hypothetical protein